ncbi:MAG: hypothetical protein ACK2UW_08640 [Anaerolineales bacterium]|jgi:hypothetical protein
MKAAFERVDSRALRGWFTLTFCGSLLLMLALNVIGAPLTTEAAPIGIVSYELAFSQTRAQAILASWDQRTSLLAAFTLGLDYLFMVFYAVAISIGVWLSAGWLAAHRLPLSRAGIWLAVGAWAAAGSDAIENSALLAQLVNAPDQFWAVLAGISAVLKFSLIFLGIVYALYALVLRLVQRWMPAGDREG